jgi:RNA polymerase sigma-70 factor, ECF subfamily
LDEKADSRSDFQLVAAFNRGDWAAFDLLYHRHRDWTFRLAWRFAGNETDAHDVVQEVFVYLAQKLRTGLDLRAGLTTLLYPAVKHSALALKRKRARWRPMNDDLDRPAPPPQAPPGTARSELAAALAALSDAHREVLLMRFVDDMSLQEIGLALAIPLGTVKSRLHHALAELREDERMLRRLE